MKTRKFLKVVSSLLVIFATQRMFAGEFRINFAASPAAAGPRVDALLHRADVQQLVAECERSGLKYSASEVWPTVNYDGLLLRLRPHQQAQPQTAIRSDHVKDVYLFYRSAGPAGPPLLLTTHLGTDHDGRPFVEFQLPDRAVRITTTDQSLIFNDNPEPYLARPLWDVVANDWDFGTISHCFFEYSWDLELISAGR